MQRQRLKFTKDQGNNFYTEARINVYDFFKSNDLSIYADSRMFVKTVIFLVIFAGSYTLILFTPMSPVYSLLLCAVHGAAIAGIGFNIAHDAGHQSYFRKMSLNRLLVCSMDLVGSNSYMWDLKHNKAHHIYTNIESFDEDIRGAFLLRLSPHAPYHQVNKGQFIYAWFLYFIVYFFIVWVYNFQQFLMKSYGPFVNLSHPAREWIKLIAWKLFYIFYAVYLPVRILDLTWYQFAIGYFIVCAAAGFILAIVFYLAHCVEKTAEFPLPENEQLKTSWAVHQMKSTSNFGINNKWLTWFAGGLNYQIEHHLFPEICSIHYPQISKIVRRAAYKYNVPYHEYPTLSGAVKSHFRMLKKLGQPVFIK